MRQLHAGGWHHEGRATSAAHATTSSWRPEVAATAPSKMTATAAASMAPEAGASSTTITKMAVVIEVIMTVPGRSMLTEVAAIVPRSMGSCAEALLSIVAPVVVIVMTIKAPTTASIRSLKIPAVLVHIVLSQINNQN